MKHKYLIILFFLSKSTIPVAGQVNVDKHIDKIAKFQLIDELKKKLKDSYVFIDIAQQIESDLNRRILNNEYTNISSSKELAKKLQDDLQGISKDKHLRMYFSSEPIPATQQMQPTTEEKNITFWFEKRNNWGFAKFERLEGNIGFLQLNSFEEPDRAIETVTAAMNLLSNTDALIIDLRQNGGGSPAMVPLISSYFFKDSIHLNDIYWRQKGMTEPFWTTPSVKGKKYIDKPVYILTSKYTFSAAEASAYNLNTLKRSLIVGETTRGGANPGERFRLSDHFEVFIPTGQAINPITKANWEGIGIKPDIMVPKDQALKTAYILALKEVIDKVPYTYIKNAMEEIIKENQKQLDEMKAKTN